tara:strand:- start:446 stop:586 length:141 start_codon:yes stop_codon:yes gene_type:complete
MNSLLDFGFSQISHFYQFKTSNVPALVEEFSIKYHLGFQDTFFNQV